MTELTELERLQKAVIKTELAYEAAVTAFPKAEYYDNLDELEACNTTYAAWVKARVAFITCCEGHRL